MGNGFNYTPDQIVEKYRGVPIMQEYIRIYGTLRKHEGNDAEIEYLFKVIYNLERVISSLTDDIQKQKLYVHDMEAQLEKVLRRN